MCKLTDEYMQLNGWKLCILKLHTVGVQITKARWSELHQVCSLALTWCFEMSVFFSSPPGWSTKHCHKFACSLYVCLFGCLSASITQTPDVPNFTNFPWTLVEIAAGSSSGGVAICYVHPVLWKTAYLHITAKHRRRKKGVACSKWLTRGSIWATSDIYNWLFAYENVYTSRSLRWS